MTLEVTAFSDFVCPWCYIGLAEVERLRSEFDIKLTWRPFLLWPGTPPEGRPLPDRIKQYEANPDNPMRLRARSLGLKMAVHLHIPSTLRAHQASHFAAQQGKHAAFHYAVLKHYWELGEDISQWPVLRAAAVEVGLDADRLQQEVDAGLHTEAVEKSLSDAGEIGVSAVPTFIVNDKYLVQGAQDAAAFRQLFQQIAEE